MHYDGPQGSKRLPPSKEEPKKEYKFTCFSCKFKNIIKDVGGWHSVCCSNCAYTHEIINHNGLTRNFQDILDKGTPKDKWGIKVQVGDIVKVERSGGTCFGVIEWRLGAGFLISYISRHNPGHPKEIKEYICVGQIENDHEILGNIYIRPELLPHPSP